LKHFIEEHLKDLLQTFSRKWTIALFWRCFLQQDEGHAMFQAGSHWPCNAKDWFQTHASQHVICDGQSDTGTGFTLSTSVFPCQCQSTNAKHSFIHLSSMIHNLGSSWQH